MKFAALVLKSAVRNKRRTLLTVLSLGASLFLLVTLHTVLYEIQATSTTPESDLRLWTRHSVSIANLLPVAYREQIRQVPGVAGLADEPTGDLDAQSLGGAGNLRASEP